MGPSQLSPVLTPHSGSSANQDTNHQTTSSQPPAQATPLFQCSALMQTSGMLSVVPEDINNHFSNFQPCAEIRRYQNTVTRNVKGQSCWKVWGHLRSSVCSVAFSGMDPSSLGQGSLLPP